MVVLLYLVAKMFTSTIFVFREYGYFDRRITFRWGLNHPTTKYHRDVLFGFEDLVGKASYKYTLLKI